ncbi:hypothetical protein ACROYT_G024408 [Oculina patagonica]
MVASYFEVVVRPRAECASVFECDVERIDGKLRSGNEFFITFAHVPAVVTTVIITCVQVLYGARQHVKIIVKGFPAKPDSSSAQSCVHDDMRTQERSSILEENDVLQRACADL